MGYDISRRQNNLISHNFAAARIQALGLDDFPGQLPVSLEQAYDIQNKSISMWDDKVAGWKIGGVPDAYKRRFNADMLVGPVFEKLVYPSKKPETIVSVYGDGFAAFEAEIVFKLGEDVLPNETMCTASDLLAKIDSCHIGVEIASSPLKTINELGPMAIISDFGNNSGLIVGEEISDWQQPGRKVQVGVDIDNRKVGKQRLVTLDNAFLAYEFLVSHCRAHSRTLPKGSLITTGAITGVHQIFVGEKGCADFGPDGQITAIIDSIEKLNV